MYICICKAVTDQQLETAISQGLCTRKQLIQCFGVGRDCGKCNKDVHQLLHCHHSQKLMNASNETTI
ncbi:(2Fe-2S)-binding protein [Methyloprofundus sedimenti]|uniref:(2Fe-2S)-binding protein n=1 Tax=Methyloprofundus sedimenti TaxID=1420851 RepID=UPI0009B6E344|nr:(2Fe-2S)-binding protein [Methyloprofundus sedimenti]